MEKHESSVEILINSIKYPFSSLRSFLIGGFVTIFYFFYIGIPFILGYQVRCGRSILSGDETLPEWGDIVGLLKDGILALAILLVYGFVIMIVGFVLYIPMIVASLKLEGSALALVFLIFIAILMILIIPLSMLMYISLLIFIETSDPGKAINPLNAFKILKSGPLEFIKAFGVQIVASFILMIPLMLLYLVTIASYFIEKNLICCTGLILIIAVPWLVFVPLPMMMYVYTKYYQRVTGAGLTDATTG